MLHVTHVAKWSASLCLNSFLNPFLLVFALLLSYRGQTGYDSSLSVFIQKRESGKPFCWLFIGLQLCCFTCDVYIVLNKLGRFYNNY